MKESIIIVNCKVPSEAYQILSMLRQDPESEGVQITHAAIVKQNAGSLSLEDGFITGDAFEGRGWTGGLIGSLIGILAGPLGVLLGGSIGSMIGDSMDIKEMGSQSALLEKAGECLVERETALLLMAQETDETVLEERLKDFQISITRMDAKEIASEIEGAEKKDVSPNRESGNQPITEGSYDKSVAVKCNNGSFVGKKTDELIVWKGIPYATQPVGKLRWKKALPAADDDGVYDATEPGHIPIGPADDSMGTAEFGEDCLVLNIYSNTACTDTRKPVMVWIHGGGFCAESQASPLYDLANISRQCPDILFVSIDYRLGFLGFMNFERVPGGEDFREAGNLGLLDQLESLRWIQKNIAGFGGDPDNVTIFGESAGSASVTFLPLIDGSEGLFRRIIAQSANVAYCDTMEHGIHVTQNFLTATGCQTMDELMELTTEDLVDAYLKAGATDKNCLLGFANFPLLDGVTLPEDRAVMYEMWGDEKRSEIDMMIGSNQDEVRYFVPSEGGEEGFADTLRWIVKRDRALLNEQEKAMYDEFMATLADESEGKRLEQYCNDINFRAGNTNMAIRHSAAGGNTYMYFMKKPATTEELGVIHSAEIPYLFDTPMEDPMGSGKIVSNEECEFRHVIKEMWTNFARTGDPSTDKYEWKKFSGDDRQTMVFDDTIGMQKDLFGRREDLMMSWAERLGNGSSKRVC